jgi:iron complex transport system ATP-binding protein
MDVLKLENVSFRYSRELVIDDVSFRVGEGEFVGIIGPNGSGKTTLLRLMDGILSPEKGAVELDGRALAQMGRRLIARAVAVVPQEAPLTFPFSVREIVLMGRAPHLPVFGFESGQDFEIAAKAMEVTETAQFADRTMGSLSGGERQRVLIARALAQQPRVMLLDEPTAFMDIRHQVEIFDLVRSLRDGEGLTVVAVTHDINLASLYSDKIVLLRAGKIFSEGRPEDVLTAANIEDVYRTRALVDSYPGTGLPRITPVRNGTGPGPAGR